MARRTRSHVSNEQELTGKPLKIARHIVFLDAFKSYLEAVRQAAPNSQTELPDFESIVSSVSTTFDLPDELQKEYNVKVISKTPFTPKQIDFIFELIHNELPSRPEYNLFKRSVDPDRDGAPDYYQVISSPMCFETIKSKIEEKTYDCADSLKSDLDLVFDNAMKYTPTPTHDVHRAAKRMKHYVDFRWSQLPDSQKIHEVVTPKTKASNELLVLSKKIQTIKNTDPTFLKTLSDAVFADTKIEDRPKRLILTAYDSKTLAMINRMCDDVLSAQQSREGTPETFGTTSRTIGEDVNI